MAMRKWSTLSAIGERDSIGSVITGSDVWHYTGLDAMPIPNVAGELMELVSTDAQDSATGTGVQKVLVHYLDPDGVPGMEEVTMNGLTPVPIFSPNSNIRFVQDIHSTQVGSNGVAEGDIHIRSVSTPANVYDMIKAGGNMSLSISKMVPAGKTLHITRWGASASGKYPVTLRLRSTDHHGQLYEGTFLFKDTATLENSSYSREWSKEEWFDIPELSIVKVSAWTSQPGANIAAHWSGALIG